MKKKAQIEEWLVHVIFYLVLLIVLGIIVWALITGKAQSLWGSIVDKMRFI